MATETDKRVQAAETQLTAAINRTLCDLAPLACRKFGIEQGDYLAATTKACLKYAAAAAVVAAGMAPDAAAGLELANEMQRVILEWTDRH